MKHSLTTNLSKNGVPNCTSRTTPLQDILKKNRQAQATNKTIFNILKNKLGEKKALCFSTDSLVRIEIGYANFLIYNYNLGLNDEGIKKKSLIGEIKTNKRISITTQSTQGFWKISENLLKNSSKVKPFREFKT